MIKIRRDLARFPCVDDLGISGKHMSSFFWLFFAFDVLPAASAAALIYAAHRSRSQRALNAWARALRILGCQSILSALLSSIALFFLFLDLSVPSDEIELNGATHHMPVAFDGRDTLIWSSGPFIAGIVLRAASWMLRRRARSGDDQAVKPDGVGAL